MRTAETRWSDLHLWRMFLQEDWCRAATVQFPTGLCTHTHLRPHLTAAGRSDELGTWRARMREPDFRTWFEREALGAISRQAILELLSVTRLRGRNGG